jgi:hypothetical protein
VGLGHTTTYPSCIAGSDPVGSDHQADPAQLPVVDNATGVDATRRLSTEGARQPTATARRAGTISWRALRKRDRSERKVRARENLKELQAADRH